MEYIPQIIFAIALIITGWFFARNAGKIRRNILLGQKEDRTDQKGKRFKKMMLIAFGQKKMFKKPIPAFLHLFVYIGFIIINIEILEIIVDGLFGTHRVLQPFFGEGYTLFISSFEFLAISVIIACTLFLIRRNIIRIRRFWANEMTKWPKLDANLILYFEIALMMFFLFMNAADLKLQEKGAVNYMETGTFYFSQFLTPLLSGMSISQLVMVERFAWWAHIIGIFLFMNYIPFSKHLHIFLAFPNTYYSKLDPMGKVKNMDTITNEVKMMLDPSAAQDEGAAPPPEEMKFGAKDANDLTWKHLLDAYSCTECGRCTGACPANQTGKLLSPRKIMMDTRDRIEEIGKNRDKHGKDFADNKSLIGDYITKEELNACTTCNACVEACPVNIDPLSIITELRRNLIMEAADAPNEWNMMFNNVENNQAPWQFSPTDRDKWKEKIQS